MSKRNLSLAAPTAAGGTPKHQERVADDEDHKREELEDPLAFWFEVSDSRVALLQTLLFSYQNELLKYGDRLDKAHHAGDKARAAELKNDKFKLELDIEEVRQELEIGRATQACKRLGLEPGTYPPMVNAQTRLNSLRRDREARTASFKAELERSNASWNLTPLERRRLDMLSEALDEALTALGTLQPKPLRVVTHTLHYASFDNFTVMENHVFQLLDQAPTHEARKFVFPVILGPMGIGKTRACEEIANNVQHRRVQSGNRIRTFVLYLDIAKFSSRATVLPGDPLTVLAQAIIFSQNPGFNKDQLATLTFERVVRAIQPQPSDNLGRKEIILYMDEIQANRELAGELLSACDGTMLDGLHGLVVVPLASGILSPVFDTLPSGSGMKSYRLRPFAPDDGTLVSHFCTAIGVTTPTNQLDEKAPNLFRLITLCDGHPYLLSCLAESILQAKADAEFANALPNIESNKARLLFTNDLLGRINGLYGMERWHSLLGGDEKDASLISSRPSYRLMTRPMLRRLMLDAFTGRRIESPETTAVIPTTREIEEILAIKNTPTERRGKKSLQIPTYEQCIEAGLLTIDPDSKAVSLPLLGLLCMNRIISVLPDVALSDPFDENFATWEAVVMGLLYLDLTSESELTNGMAAVMETPASSPSTSSASASFQLPRHLTKLTELRPAGVWNGCENIWIDLSRPALDVRFVKLGAKLNPPSGAIHSEADGLGNPLSELKNGLVVLTIDGQEGVDGFCVLVCWLWDPHGNSAPECIHVLVLNQTKSREVNVENGEACETTLPGSGVVEIIEMMRPKVDQLRALFPSFFQTRTEIVFDIFSNRFDPVKPHAGLDAVSDVKYVISRKDAMRKALPAPFQTMMMSESRATKRVRQSTLNSA